MRWFANIWPAAFRSRSRSRSRGRAPSPAKGAAIRCPLSAVRWLTLACVAFVGCEGQPVEPPPSEMKVLLLGLDGASWNVMQPMLERGALPNLRRFVDDGVTATMESELPCLSIVLWTNVATGKPPEDHGIQDWSYVDPETGEKSLMSSTRRKVPALWNILTAAEMPVGFVNWWATWPAEPVNGFIVSERFTRARAGESLDRITYPESLAEELVSGHELEWPWLSAQLASGGLKVLSDREDSAGRGSFEERLDQALFLYGQDYRGETALFRLLETHPAPRLLGYLSRKIDIASHYMWQFADEPRPDEESLSRILEPVYRYEDELLGRLVAAVGPDVNVIIVSDHGFTWESDGWGHEESAPPGIFLAMGPDFRAGVELSPVRLYDVAPTVLHLLGLPVARDMGGEPLLAALADERPPPRWIESYDGLSHQTHHEVDSPVDQRILDELEALGYVP